MIPLIKHAFHQENEMRKEISNFFLGDNFLSMGENVKNFEKEFAKKQKTKYAVMVNSGSSANLLLIQSLLNLGLLNKGDKVGFSALTWATNVMPLIQLGLNPVPIDCSIKTLNVSPDTLENCLPDIDALFLTNVLGFADDIQKIEEMCKASNTLFIEDNCESLGSKVNGKLLGNFGKASTFSFYIGHHISTIEGGMVVTNDKELYECLLMSRSHGWARNLEQESAVKLQNKYSVSELYTNYTFYNLAFNVRPMEVQGFIGLAQVQYWDEIVQRREENYKKFYSSALQNQSLIHFQLDHMDIISNFAFPLVWKDESAFKNSLDRFRAAQVEIRPIIAGDITQQPFYQKYFTKQAGYKNAQQIHQLGFYFGNNQHMNQVETSTLCDIIVR